jgi:hypothetical protein
MSTLQVPASTSTARLLSAAATVNNTLVKGSPAVLYRIRGYNAKASAVFLKLYDKATAPVAGTDTPRATFRLAPTADFDLDLAMRFQAGLGYAITGLAADNDTTVLVAADVVALNINYR